MPIGSQIQPQRMTATTVSASGISTAAATSGTNHLSCLAVNWNTIPICFSRWPNETFSCGALPCGESSVRRQPVEPRTDRERAGRRRSGRRTRSSVTRRVAAGRLFERKQEGLVRLGTYSFEPFTVTINGDEAEVHGCFDGTSSFMVKRGETQPGVGSKPGDRRENEITLEPVDGVWLVSFPFANGKPC